MPEPDDDVGAGDARCGGHGDARPDGERRRRRPPLRGHVLPRGARRDDPRVQGRVGRHRRLDRRRRRRRHLELPHPHRRHRRRRSRPRSTAAGPARSASPTSSSRSRRSAGCARASRAAAASTSRRTSTSRSRPRSSPSPTGDGIRRIFHSLGVQRIVTGGQSMNPSTAELLEAVEAAPADEVVILPEQQEHHRRWPSRSTRRRRSRARRADPGHHRGLRRARRLRPRGAVDETPTRWPTAAAQRRRRRGDPGRARLVVATSARSTRATTSASPATASSRSTPTLGRRVRPRCSTQLVGDDHEIVTIIEGDGATAGRHPAHHRVAARAPPRRRRPRCTTAASRCTRTSSASSRPWPGGLGAAGRRSRSPS